MRWATPRELRLGMAEHGGEVRDGGVAKDAEACLIQRLRRRRDLTERAAWLTAGSGRSAEQPKAGMGHDRFTGAALLEWHDGHRL